MKPGDRIKWTVGIDRYRHEQYPDQSDEILNDWLYYQGIQIAHDQRANDPPDMIAIAGHGQTVGFRVLVPRAMAQQAWDEWRIKEGQ